ncbi:putative PHD type zinc finger protein with BAH domain-containing protein [Neurospora sp. IMI 360204]|nr:putative PHD type zinc finger protein with BAH domain-containing protein [Neurospora sp. IMI 360204]
MAQKNQHVIPSEEQTNSASRTLSAKEKEGAATASANANSTKQSATTPASTSSGTSSAAISNVLPRISDPSPLPPTNSEPSTDAPMGKSTSTSTQAAAAAKDGSTAANPYGTRSRNRTGNSRINYAEDRDLDMDIFELYPDRREGAEAKKGSSKQAQAPASSATTQAATPSSSSPTNGASQPAPRTAVNGTSASTTVTSTSTSASRKPLPTIDDVRKGHSSKDQQSRQPSTSPAANGATTTTTNGPTKSKKRKADPAANASSSQTPTSAANSSASHNKRIKTNSHDNNGNSKTPTNSDLGMVNGYGETNLLTFENTKAMPKDGKMVADDGTVLEVNDHVYLVCEPPGEPYYLGRIMEFLHTKNDAAKPVDALRVNWYYRPKDIGRRVQDTRMVFATMHSDISPLTALRGKCQIRHKTEIPDLAAYKRARDCFWFEKLYDRYIQKNYEVIPTKQIINVPEHVKKVLDERWKYILVEQGRGKELTSAVKTCKRCVGYCASNDSVDCAVCQNTYHMNCVRPPLLKKPSRGFAWSCAACSRAQERKLEARNTPNVLDPNGTRFDDDDEFLEDDEEDPPGVQTGMTSRTSPATEDLHQEATAEQIYQCSLWPYRYLGMHCKVEDALDYDDRIFPRASTRLGPRHQAVVVPWYGRPVQYVKPLEIKKTGRKDGKLNKEQQALLEAERKKRETRPQWIQDEPAGYVERGGDDTVTPLYKPPERCGKQMSNEAIDEFMDKARGMAVELGLPPRSTNLQDVARDLLFKNDFDPKKALQQLSKVPKEEFKEPELTPAELKKFEEGVGKYGSELHLVMKHVKTLRPATVTRFYYTWKKTERGKQIWGNFAARKGKRDAKKAEAAATKQADDVADDHDDSAFDAGKAKAQKKAFMCKFCGTKASRQWRRAPTISQPIGETSGRSTKQDKKGEFIPALCRRCAELWRRYAIQWEDVDEVAKKVAQTAGRNWKRKVDEDLYKELLAADEMIANTKIRTPEPTPVPTLVHEPPAAGQEPPRKKLKGSAREKDKEKEKVEKEKEKEKEKELEPAASEPGSVASTPTPVVTKKKEKVVEKPVIIEKPAPPPPPPVPEIPKPRTLPCAICRQMEPMGDQHLSCKECRMTVHRNCYGVLEHRAPGKWTCDMCLNDKNPQVSLSYKCVLCPVEKTEHDFVGPPKNSHKKKTEKERERERQERENAIKAAEYYRKKQEEMNRPVDPREPLKRTADNNWVHVTCAVWTPEVKFGNAKALAPIEGIPLINRAKYSEICRACKKDGGACVSCYHCKSPVHVECAHKAGHVLGFDITPVKGSRRDQHNIVTLGSESGTMSAAIWCKEHAPQKGAFHPMHEKVDESGMTALQLYVQSYKQADLTLTGCARKAIQITPTTRPTSSSATSASHQTRRISTIHLLNGDHGEPAPGCRQPGSKICLTCGTDVSPKWYPIDEAQERGLVNGYYGNLGSEAQKFIEQRSVQCHKCKKEGRQPHVHPKREPTPPPPPAPLLIPAVEPVVRPVQVSQAPPVAPPAPVTTAPTAVMDIPGRQPGPSPFWSPRVQAAPIPPPLAHPAPIRPPVSHPLVPVSGPVAPQVAPPPTLPSNLAPRGPSMPQSLFGSAPPRPYDDWHRQPSGHPPPLHPGRQLNGTGPSPPPLNTMPSLAPPNHLRPSPSLSIANLTHAQPPPPPPQNGHMAHPSAYARMDGLPPSPRRVSGQPTTPSGGSYLSGGSLHSHGGPPDLRPPTDLRTDLRPHNMLNHPMPPHHVAGPPPPHPAQAEQHHPLSFLRHWNNHTAQQNQPPPLHHTSSYQQVSGLPPPPRDNKPKDIKTGASSSPSLRNLLH